MGLYAILLILFPVLAFALDFSEIEELKNAISESEMQKRLGDVDQCGDLPGVVIFSAFHNQIPSDDEYKCDSHAQCRYDGGGKKKKDKKKHTEVITQTELLLISEIHTPQINRGSVE